MSTPTKSRQKSCEQCVGSKRQCDRGSPKCSRCTVKGLHCLYKSAPPTQSAEVEHFAPLSNGQFDGVFPNIGITQAPSLDNMFSEGAGIQTLSTPMPLHISLPDVSMSMVDAENLAIDGDLFTAFNNYAVSNRRDPFACEIGVMDRPRIRFLIRQMKQYPHLLVQNGKAPFIHLQASYPLIPPALQDAISASALYLSKNEKNEAMVWDIVSAKVTALMEPRPSWSVAEHLSCLQALVIYQIIRLFDGDIRARSDAESTEDILVDWTDRLVLRTGANTSQGTVISNTWENWVFEEVVSRTIIVSRMVQAMFMIVKQGFCTLVEAVTELSFTAQRALWHAPTAVHWQQACKQNRRFYLHKMDFGELMEKGDLSEVDELGVLMLVCYKGVDGVNEWIVKKGGTALLE
jgi:Fungal Zn(2)-Cys(6) binuclear cluster domain